MVCNLLFVIFSFFICSRLLACREINKRLNNAKNNTQQVTVADPNARGPTPFWSPTAIRSCVCQRRSPTPGKSKKENIKGVRPTWYRSAPVLLCMTPQDGAPHLDTCPHFMGSHHFASLSPLKSVPLVKEGAHLVCLKRGEPLSIGFRVSGFLFKRSQKGYLG